MDTVQLGANQPDDSSVSGVEYRLRAFLPCLALTIALLFTFVQSICSRDFVASGAEVVGSRAVPGSTSELTSMRVTGRRLHQASGERIGIVDRWERA